MDILDKVAIRYYQWAQDDFQREIREGFTFLQRIKDRYISFRVLPIMKSLNSLEQQTLASALLKHFHPRAVRLLDEGFTSEEQAMFDWYSEVRRAIPSEELQHRELEVAGKIHYKVDRKVFRQQLKESLEPILGTNVEYWGRSEWNYQTKVGKLNLMTFVDIGGDYHQLTYGHCLDYEHDITDAERLIFTNPPNRAFGYTSMLAWLGLSSETTWDMLTDADVEETAQTLALFCSHFLKALENILDGFESV